ncbi:MAG: hypothetical protein M0P47_05810 [Bacteroidales bacterium]|nr:hypothetical protein [Bacteroidales bacterium]
MRTKIFLPLLMICCFAMHASAWVFPEHREIMMAAITKLDPNRRAILDQIWASARKGYESRLCIEVIELEQGLKPQCIDYATWCAIAGDHAVSSADMTNIVLQSDWILDVTAIAAKLQFGLDNAHNRSERISEMRDSDIKLLRADPEYVTRGGKNNGHFMLALPAVNTKPEAFFSLCYKEGTEINTIGTYTWYHMSALSKASRLNSKSLTPEQRSALALSALADEAFAAHFLEDSFTSGHVAGIWGDAAKRKGTHDYYNEAGLNVTTWQGKEMVLMGDATMREEDIGWTSRAVRTSLEQLLDAASGKILVDAVPVDLFPATPDTFNVSKAVVMPIHPIDAKMMILCDTVLMATPIPGLIAGLGELPRFRAEIGPFVGLSAATSLNYLDGGFFNYQTYNGFSSGLELGLRFGLGMEGVLNESGDGLVFLDLGARIDLGSTMRYDYNDEPIMQSFGDFAAAIPSRDAYYVRLRLPFFLIPGDLVILAPILALTSPNTMQKVITTAGNGGLIPWQTGLPTPIGRFQFVLGREVAVSMYGTGRGPDRYLVTIQDAINEQGGPVEGYYSMYSTRFEFPIVEYRPFRTYSSRQTGSLLFQLHGGFDIPGKRSTIAITDGKDYALPETRTIWYAGIRLVFDYRYYFSGKKK